MPENKDHAEDTQESTLLTGKTGTGKPSGSGQQIVEHILLGYPEGLILTAKPEPENTNASQNSPPLDEAWTDPYTGETFIPPAIVEELRKQIGKEPS